MQPREKATKNLPFGIGSFEDVIENCYYVDKTELLEKLVALPKGSVMLFTRPRRFGKTLALSMVDTFLNFKEENAKHYFAHTKIYRNDLVMRKISSYPVIHMSMKDVIGTDSKMMFRMLRAELYRAYAAFPELESSNKLSSVDQSFYHAVRSENLSDEDLPLSLRKLMDMASSHYSMNPVLLLDEYDSPIQSAYDSGYYDEAIHFFKVFYGSALKGNPNLQMAILSGVMQMAKESMFSGLNNVIVNSVLDSTYDEYFGFVDQEVDELLKVYGLESQRGIAEKWYGGYQFGKEKIYNPWPIIRFVASGGEVKPYWQITGENLLLRELLKTGGEDSIRLLSSLVKHEETSEFIDFTMNYKTVPLENKTFLSLLLGSGYLTVDKDYGYNLYSLKIPNKEIQHVFEEEILKFNRDPSSFENLLKLKYSFMTGDTKKIEEYLESVFLFAFSYYDFSNEKKYQILLLTLNSILFEKAIVKSEANEGNRRCDILISPLEKNQLGIVIEIKAYKGKVSLPRLENYSLMALKQIEEKDYTEELKKKAAKPILAYGIAFSEKKVKISKSFVKAN